MEFMLASIKDENSGTSALNHIPKLDIDDSYVCPTCSNPIEILKIDDKENTLTFKCLNPKENEKEKTIKITEYLDSMRKYTYLNRKCSLCNKKQNEFKNVQFFFIV